MCNRFVDELYSYCMCANPLANVQVAKEFGATLVLKGDKSVRRTCCFFASAFEFGRIFNTYAQSLDRGYFVDGAGCLAARCEI